MAMARPKAPAVVIFFALLAPLALPVPAVQADTRYVSDELLITMRSGQGTDYRIIKSLTSGTPVEVLEEDGEYLRVRTQDGEEGWVLSQYITSQTPKAAVIGGLRAEVDRLKTKMAGLEEDRTALRAELDAEKGSYAAKLKELEKTASATKQEATRTARELKRTAEKYDALVAESKDVVTLVEERNMLREEHDRLTAVNDHLQQENNRLRRTGMIKWFLAGGAVFLVGWLVGKASRKKRYY